MRNRTQIKRRAVLLSGISFLLLTIFPVAFAGAPASTREVRSAVERAFQQLRAGDYGALYNFLPADSQRRLSRERFTTTLERTRGMYELNRLEINTADAAGNVAVVDTILYGRMRRPVDSEGKIVARQYLVREGGQWRVAVGNRAVIERLLASNPQFARRYPARDPRIYIKRNGQWVSIGTMNALRRALG